MKNTKRVLAFLVGAAMMMPMVSAESANEYEATAQGFGGPVTVKITVDGGNHHWRKGNARHWRRGHQDAERKADRCFLCR